MRTKKTTTYRVLELIQEQLYREHYMIIYPIPRTYLVRPQMAGLGFFATIIHTNKCHGVIGTYGLHQTGTCHWTLYRLSYGAALIKLKYDPLFT